MARVLWAAFLSPAIFSVAAFLYFFGLPLGILFSVAGLLWLCLVVWVGAAGRTWPEKIGLSIAGLIAASATSFLWFDFNLAPEKRFLLRAWW